MLHDISLHGLQVGQHSFQPGIFAFQRLITGWIRKFTVRVFSSWICSCAWRSSSRSSLSDFSTSTVSFFWQSLQFLTLFVGQRQNFLRLEGFPSRAGASI